MQFREKRACFSIMLCEGFCFVFATAVFLFWRACYIMHGVNFTSD